MRFAVFAGLVYFVQATGSTGGIAGQTISFYCKEGLGWSSGTVAYFWGESPPRRLPLIIPLICTDNVLFIFLRVSGRPGPGLERDIVAPRMPQ